MKFEQIYKDAVNEWKSVHNDKIPRIFINLDSCGRAAGAAAIAEHINAEIKKNKIFAKVIEVGSTGLSYLEPLIYIRKNGQPAVFYGKVTEEVASQILNEYVTKNNPLPELALCTMGAENIPGIPQISELPIYKGQIRIALRNCGLIDPCKIKHYIARDGYGGLKKALKSGAKEVIEEIERAGLRGRGGAGFSTARKWKICREVKAEEKYVICNAHEGDPASFGIRLLLESDPHAVLEGMLICAFSVGANKGYIYINNEYALAIERVKIALSQMKEVGLLGGNILESGFSFDIEVFHAGAEFVCGEESALIRSIEGKRGMSYTRPPFPAVSGLFDKPTVVNNAETLAHVSAILQKGADWYASVGNEKSRGSKLFVLSGNIARPAIVELPMGTSLGEIINNIGGGVPDEKEFKAAQIGGPSGALWGADVLDVPLDYEGIEKEEATLGSGSIVVFNNESCIVDICRQSLSFSQQESCGFCVFCREGTMQILEFLKDITEGKGKSEDIDFLLELGESLKLASLCGLGKSAANPVISGIKYFRDEYIAHTNRKRCTARVCKSLITYHVLPDKCQGCQICLQNCPASAIKGGEKLVHVIDQSKCTKCGVCLEACPLEYSAITGVSGRKVATPTEPIPVGTWEEI